MTPSERALELVAPYCDLRDRLEVIPPSACVRGMYFKQIEAELERRGRIAPYRELFEGERWSALAYYALGDYLVRIAYAGAVVASPATLHDGMHMIARANATAFASSLLGRALLRLLSRDPVRLTEQGLAAKRQSHTYGHWELVKHGPRMIEVLYRDEYQWIESVIAGAAVGTFEACGLSPSLETRLTDRFNGSTLVRW